MFGNIYKNSFKILVRDKATVFWTVIFTILLAIMFKMTFSKLDEIDKFEPVPISVSQKVFEDEYFKTYIEAMEKEEYIKLIDLNDEGEEKLFKEKKIVAYIQDEENIIVGKSVGKIKETIIKSLMDGYIQNKSMIMNVLKENPYANIGELLDFKSFVKDESKKSIDIVSTYFYTLIGMQALYSYLWGLRVMYMYEANLSTQGKRNTISPVNKKYSVLYSLLAAWALSVITSVICLIFISFILKVDIGSQLLGIMTLILVGTLTGVSFGAFIAVSNKQNAEFKNGIGVGVTMLWSFFAGMMSSDVKILVQRNIPIVNKFNPVALITDGLYSLAVDNTLDRFYENLLFLSIIIVLFVLGTIFFVRGKKYESL
ncbi:MAG: ABC transporter permease [Candidatus Dojkabacteria bacterium]|jgi:ABC-2 type transport system permease protein